MRSDPAASDQRPAPWKDVTRPSGSRTSTIASPPTPHAWGATTASAACAATAASTALPPATQDRPGRLGGQRMRGRDGPHVAPDLRCSRGPRDRPAPSTLLPRPPAAAEQPCYARRLWVGSI